MKCFYNYSLNQQQQEKKITKKEMLRLKKCRIIQRNLVHFYGFPDYLYNEQILGTKEYFGQYGVIIKIVLANREDKKILKTNNSAYITFSTDEQAAYSILSVDSIMVGDHLVRAFFGTNKYCRHFINNEQCSNQENCKFLHHLAKKSDIIDDNFGYSEHIKLAKKVISFGSYYSKCYILNNKYNYKTILPNIETIYDINTIEAKKKNHRDYLTFSNNNSLPKTCFNEDIENNDSPEGSFISVNNITHNNKINHENKLFESKNESRFFNIKASNNKSESLVSMTNKSIDLENIRIIIDNIINRQSFFILFDNYKFFYRIELEYNYCRELYNKTNDIEIKKIIENTF